MQTAVTLPMLRETERAGDDVDLFRDLVRFHGLRRASCVLGFCRLWAASGCVPLNEVRASLKEAGLSKSGAYRYLDHLREWHDGLRERAGRDVGSLEDVARRLAYP
jgi:hypothetical protein